MRQTGELTMDKRGPKGEIHRAVVLDWKESLNILTALDDMKRSKERNLRRTEKKGVDDVCDRLRAAWRDV